MFTIILYKITGGCFITMEGDIIVRNKNVELTYTLSILAVLLTIITLSLCYLVMSSKIKLRNTGYVDSKEWSVAFGEISDVIVDGATKEIQRPYTSGNSTTMENFSVLFNKPKDSITYKFRVDNKGVFNARVADITYSLPKCEGTGENAKADAELVCNNLEFRLSYSDGRYVDVDDVLYAGDIQDLSLKIGYLGESLPRNSVKVNGITATVIYVQY